MAVHKMLHNLGDTDQHGSATLSQLNALISDGTLDTTSDPRDPNAHKTDHENGGGDEISVAGLSGLLADAQTPSLHAGSHEGGGDAVSPAGIGAAADPHTLEGASHTLTFLTNGTIFGRNAAAAIAAIPFAKAATGDTIAQRESDGRVKVATPTDNGDAAHKQYVDETFAASRLIQDPVESFQVLTDADQGGVTPAATLGVAYVVNGWAVGAYDNVPDNFNDGDLAVGNGSGFDRVVQHVLDFLPNGTRFVVQGPTGGGAAGGGLAGEDAKIATADGGGLYSFEAPSDGWATLIENNEAYKAEALIQYNGDVSDLDWHLIQAALPDHNSTTGIQGGDILSDEAYHLTSAENASVANKQGSIDQLEADVALAGILPVYTDLSGAGWGAGSRGAGLGADGSIWWMYDDGATGWAVGMGSMAAL